MLFYDDSVLKLFLMGNADCQRFNRT